MHARRAASVSRNGMICDVEINIRIYGCFVLLVLFLLVWGLCVYFPSSTIVLPFFVIRHLSLRLVDSFLSCFMDRLGM